MELQRALLPIQIGNTIVNMLLDAHFYAVVHMLLDAHFVQLLLFAILIVLLRYSPYFKSAKVAVESLHLWVVIY